MVEFLNKKIGEKINPVYCIQEIDVTQLEIARADALLHYYGPIQGSKSFQVMVFTPNARSIRAAKYICVCQLCKNDYSSCQMFNEYTQNVHRINKINLRSNYDDYDESKSKNADTDDEDVSNGILEPGSIWTI